MCPPRDPNTTNLGMLWLAEKEGLRGTCHVQTFYLKYQLPDEAKSGQCATLRPGPSVHSSSMGENVVFQMMKLESYWSLSTIPPAFAQQTQRHFVHTNTFYTLKVSWMMPPKKRSDIRRFSHDEAADSGLVWISKYLLTCGSNDPWSHRSRSPAAH